MFSIINIYNKLNSHLYYNKIDNEASRKHNTCNFSVLCVASTVLDKFVIQVRQL